MRIKYAVMLGNTLMALGLMLMMSCIGLSVVSQSPGLSLSAGLAEDAIFGIFAGAILWLVGACISGREKVADRYYWLRQYGNERCRRHSGDHCSR